MNTKKKLLSLVLVVLMVSLCGSMIWGYTWYNTAQPSFNVSSTYNTDSVPSYNDGTYRDDISYQYHNTYCTQSGASVGFTAQKLNYGIWWNVGSESIGPVQTYGVWYGEGDDSNYTGGYRYRVKAYDNGSWPVQFDAFDMLIWSWSNP